MGEEDHRSFYELVIAQKEKGGVTWIAGRLW